MADGWATAPTSAPPMVHDADGTWLDRASASLLPTLPVALVAVDEGDQPFWWNDEASAFFGAALTGSGRLELEARARQLSPRVRVSAMPGVTRNGSTTTWLVVTEPAEAHELLEALAHQALHDHLTGLPNRTLLDDRLRQALERAARSGTGVAVAFLDIDHFKLINDTQGHAEGDALLRAVAERLSGAIRAGDTVARFGGDEFVVVCEQISGADEAMALAHRLREAIEAPIRLRGEDVFISSSLGIALGDGADTPETLLRDADAAMYQAKVDGRARAQLFDTAIRFRAERRRYTETLLRQALQDHEFELAYQPIISLEAGWVVGAEALVRWRHPERGIVMPGDFIPVAEETALILPLGEWVLDEACRQLRRWRLEEPDVPLVMSVNVSARQLRSGFVDAVTSAIRTHEIDPAFLQLEITEGVLMEDVNRCVEGLNELKALGVTLAIDDFGVGYSSLGYLKRFPIDVIKIDRTFIDGLGTDANDSAIVSAIAGMARALKVSVVAEGVEEAHQLYALRHLGCQQAQGYWFARPSTPEEFTNLLKERRRW